ncbi:hypothetical protein SLS62_003205 [Diatrype stigma]|uniref:Uncharacterized protein n=1 Tax=Diatrype stigma TaxID=117547 RepID=A0AAN9UWN5_9PEZI
MLHQKNPAALLLAAAALFSAAAKADDATSSYTAWMCDAYTTPDFPFEYRIANSDSAWTVARPASALAWDLNKTRYPKAGWRRQGDDTSAMVFAYDDSLPKTANATSDGDYPVLMMYETILYAGFCSGSDSSDSAQQSSTAADSDVWDSETFLPLPASATKIKVYSEACPSDTNYTVTVTDAAGGRQVLTGLNSVNATLAPDTPFPVVVEARSSDPTYGSANATLSGDLPVKYAVGSGAPTLTATRLFIMDFCPPDDD